MMDLQKHVVEQEEIDMHRDPITAAPGSHPVSTGLGAVGGLTAGIMMGSVAGPLGTAIGGAIGTVVGGFAGKGIGEAVNPTVEEVRFGDLIAQQANPSPNLSADELYWQRAFITEPYYDRKLSYEDYAPAYRAGIVDRLNNNRSWEDASNNLHAMWNRNKGASRLSWDEARQAMRAAWYRTDSELTQTSPYGLH
ncbi:MAG: hypothetical protein ABIT64_01110 [Lysobacteraceae bacterium]